MRSNATSETSSKPSLTARLLRLSATPAADSPGPPPLSAVDAGLHGGRRAHGVTPAAASPEVGDQSSTGSRAHLSAGPDPKLTCLEADLAIIRRQLEESIAEGIRLAAACAGERAEREATQAELERTRADRERLDAAYRDLQLAHQLAEASWCAEREAFEDRHNTLVARYGAALHIAHQSADDQLRTLVTSIRSAQKAVREQIADAMQRRSALSLSELGTAVEAELFVQGFDARVLPLEGVMEQRLPLTA